MVLGQHPKPAAIPRTSVRRAEGSVSINPYKWESRNTRFRVIIVPAHIKSLGSKGHDHESTDSAGENESLRTVQCLGSTGFRAAQRTRISSLELLALGSASGITDRCLRFWSLPLACMASSGSRMWIVSESMCAAARVVSILIRSWCSCPDNDVRTYAWKQRRW